MRILFSILILFFVVGLQAQEDDNEKYALTTSTFTIGVGSAKVLDPYLSPFEYNGLQIRLKNSARRFFDPSNNQFSFSRKGLIDLGTAFHPNNNNSMLFFNTNFLFGVNYHLRPMDKMMVLVGSSCDIDLGGKYLARNVNNPFSLDLFTNINATAEAQYLFKLWKQDFRAQYGLQTPLFGGMFVPMQGITYYELFVLGNLSNSFHFTSLHNKIGWSHYINLDIPTKFSTFRVSIMHDYLQYSANEMVFRKSGINFSIGYAVDMYLFSGNDKRIPSNFVNSYE